MTADTFTVAVLWRLDSLEYAAIENFAIRDAALAWRARWLTGLLAAPIGATDLDIGGVRQHTSRRAA